MERMNDITRKNLDRVGKGLHEIDAVSAEGSGSIARTFSVSVQFFMMGYRQCQEDMRKKASA